MTLKPCPFCGSKNVVNVRYIGWEGQCNDCGAEGPIGRDQEDSATRWNVRAQDPAPVDEEPLLQTVERLAASPFRPRLVELLADLEKEAGNGRGEDR